MTLGQSIEAWLSVIKGGGPAPTRHLISSDQIDAFIAKGGLLIVFYRPRWTAGGALDI
jgi:hypothetical protein